ncbi:MAG: cation-translocating P-type ATPase [Lentisphaeria bacterium]
MLMPSRTESWSAAAAHDDSAGHHHHHGPGCACCGPAETGHGHEHSTMLRFGTAIAGGLLVLNSYVADWFFAGRIDALAIDLSAIAGALILGLPILWSAVKDLLRGKVYMNELVALAILASFAIHDFRTAGTVAFLMLLTIAIEQRTAIGAEASIEALVRLTPRQARRLRADGSEEMVDALELRVGDLCRLRPGENFPVDGIIANGATTVNQASITGESLPVDKAAGAEVYAGTQNLTGMVDIRVNRVGRDTTLGKVRDLIVAAEGSRLPIMRMIDRYVGFYTPTVLTLAALVWFFTRDLNRVIAVLVISCPCALIIATPSAMIAALSAAARLGLLIKDISLIELAARIRAVVFDKTGTLTEGVLEVVKLHPGPGVELANLLAAATAAEAHSNHPAAAALRRLAEQAGVTWSDPDEYEEVPGKGVRARSGADTLRVGRASWLGECGLRTDGVEAPPEDGEHGGMSVVYVARNDQVLGWIGMRDKIRPAARAALDELRELGVRRLCMVTGDNPAAARLVADKLGVTDLHAGCLPQEKVAVVNELKRRGDVVAVIGDGVNDAPALAAGDIGVAMGAIGSDVAVQSASVALMNNDLRRLPFLIKLSRRTQALMNQNLILGLLVIVGGLYLSTIGIITPVYAALLHCVGTILIVFNSARLVRAGEELDAAPPPA